jgi:hypothetical protein
MNAGRTRHRSSIASSGALQVLEPGQPAADPFFTPGGAVLAVGCTRGGENEHSGRAEPCRARDDQPVKEEAP